MFEEAVKNNESEKHQRGVIKRLVVQEWGGGQSSLTLQPWESVRAFDLG